MSAQLDAATPRRRRHWWVLLLVGAATAALLIPAVAVLRPAASAQQTNAAEPAGHPTPTLPPVPPILPPASPAEMERLARWASAPPTRLLPGTPAREPLRALARSIRTRAADTTTGGYDYLRLQRWATEFTASGPGPARTSVVTFDESWWRNRVDGSGYTIVVRHPAGGGPARTDQAHPGGGLAGIVPDPAPTEPALLAAALNDHEPFSNGPQAVLRAVASLAGRHSLPLHVRAAVIEVLRDTDGLMRHGDTADRWGEPVVAVSVTSDNGTVRDLLLLAPTTGDIRAYELAYLRDPGRLGITTPTVDTYVQVADHQRTSRTPTG